MAKKRTKKLKKVSFKKTKKYFLAVFLILILVTFFSIINRLSSSEFTCEKVGSDLKCSWENCKGADNVLVLSHEGNDDRIQVIEEEVGSIMFSDLSGTYDPILVCGDNVNEKYIGYGFTF